MMSTPVPALAAPATGSSASSAGSAGPEGAAVLYDYREAANPIRAGLTEPLGLHRWSASLHSSGPTAIVPLDLSAELGVEGPLTSPALAAHFLRIQAGERLQAEAAACSSLFVVLRGCGSLQRAAGPGSEPLQLSWREGDVVVLPSGPAPELAAISESALCWVHDGPLLRHLGVEPSRPRFRPCHHRAETLEAALQRLQADPGAARANRMSLLLGHADLPASRTVSHTLWAMLGLVPPGARQAPHRHQSVALDLILDCDPGCYTLVGSELNGEGGIRNPQRIDWEPGGLFITPPGLWHAHSNDSGRTARLLPIQDAGLHTYLRSLDIRFSGGLGSD